MPIWKFVLYSYRWQTTNNRETSSQDGQNHIEVSACTNSNDKMVHDGVTGTEELTEGGGDCLSVKGRLS